MLGAEKQQWATCSRAGTITDPAARASVALKGELQRRASHVARVVRDELAFAVVEEHQVVVPWVSDDCALVDGNLEG
jgi:hypothetical protein